MDIEYLYLLQQFREVTNSALDNFFLYVSDFGMFQPFILISFWIFWCVDKQKGTLTLFTSSWAMVANSLLKMIACVYRPWIRDTRIEPAGNAKVTATGYSFPSGHTTLASSYLGSLAYSYRDKKVIRNSLIVMVALVMFSRNYLGVHTPQDVCIGLLTGIVFIFLSVKVLAWVEKGRNRDLSVVLIGYIVSAAFLIFVINKPYPLDYVDGTLIVDPVKMMPDSFLCAGMLCGFLTGWLWERRKICFEMPKNGVEMASRYIPGAMLATFLMYAGEAVCKQFLGVNWGGFMAMFIVMLFCTGIYPWMFRKLEKRERL